MYTCITHTHSRTHTTHARTHTNTDIRTHALHKYTHSDRYAQVHTAMLAHSCEEMLIDRIMKTRSHSRSDGSCSALIHLSLIFSLPLSLHLSCSLVLSLSTLLSYNHQQARSSPGTYLTPRGSAMSDFLSPTVERDRM